MYFIQEIFLNFNPYSIWKKKKKNNRRRKEKKNHKLIETIKFIKKFPLKMIQIEHKKYNTCIYNF